VRAGGGGFLYLRDESSAAPVLGRETGLPPRGMPKNFMLAWLLVMLNHSDLHGYEIMKTLRERFDVNTDPSSLYRALRRLERDGYISSWWDSRECGPARRVYQITVTGRSTLALWNDALEQYRSHLESFFELYNGANAATKSSAIGA